MLLCRYETFLRPEEKRWPTWVDDQWERAWQGFALFERRRRDAGAAARHRADRPRLRARLRRFPLSRLRLAQGLSEARGLSRNHDEAAVDQGYRAAAGINQSAENRSMRGQVVALIAALALGSLEANAQQTAAPAACGMPTVLEDGWTTAKPEDAGLDGARLCAIAARLKATDANVHGVVVVRSGKLVFEQYFAGHDMPWGGCRRTLRVRRHDTARHALGHEERRVAAARHCAGSQADREPRRTRAQVLPRICRAQDTRLGEDHAAAPREDVVGPAMGRKPAVGSEERRMASGQ